LLEVFGSPEGVFGASPEELATVPGVRSKVAEAIRRGTAESARREAESEAARAEREGIRIVTFRDSAYPGILRTIYGPPPFLYVRGDAAAAGPVAVAMVGTRQATSHGLGAAESIASELAAQGITIVSGLAQGIDSACHQGALAAGGRTVAVLGCGLGERLPPKREELLQRIVQRGAVFSEFAMGTPALPENFPRRNRIISGLGAATVVVEAGEHSGALITASYALEQGRDVFAVPGRIGDRHSAGCNRLIQEGAHMALSAADVLQVIGRRLPASTRGRPTERARSAEQPASARPPRPEPPLHLTEEETSVYQLLGTERRHVDEITRAMGLPAHRVAQILLSLELKGAVTRESGMRYARS